MFHNNDTRLHEGQLYDLHRDVSFCGQGIVRKSSRAAAGKAETSGSRPHRHRQRPGDYLLKALFFIADDTDDKLECLLQVSRRDLAKS
jgi:hypothetical protein